MIRMNIKNTVSELLETGLTQQALADLVPCSQSLINAFFSGKRGSRPSHAIGNRLMELHAERCTKAAAVRRATDPEPPPGHGGRQPASPTNILDTIPAGAVVLPRSQLGEKA